MKEITQLNWLRPSFILYDPLFGGMGSSCHTYGRTPGVLTVPQ